LHDPFPATKQLTTMGPRRSRKDQDVTTESHVAGALLILATLDDFNRSWRSVDDISRMIQSVFEMPRTAKDKLSGALTVSDLGKDALMKDSTIDLVANDFGLFHAKLQRKGADGKKKRMKCLCMCPPKELPPVPASGTKWFDNPQVPSPLECWENKRVGTKSDNFKMVQEGLSNRVRQLAMKTTEATQKPAPKNNRKRDKEDDAQEEGSLAKKPKAAGLPLSKLIADIAESEETTKFELMKEETVGLMNHVTAECMAKLARSAVAEQEEEDCIDAEKTNDLPLEPHDRTQQNAGDNEVREPNEPNGANETVHEPNGTNEPNEANNNQPHQHCMNTSATTADQELELTNLHVVISRSRLSRLVESDKLG
jgi:hypothetical protein